jgi:hypothetical protein
MLCRRHLNYIWHQKNTPWSYQYTHKPDRHTYIKLNPTYEKNGCFFDLFVIQKPSSLEIDVFRKPTTTDTTINFFQNHPIKHKIATFRYHITIRLSLPLVPKKKQKEWTSIQLTERNNNFPQNLLRKLNWQIQHKKQEKTKEETKKKNWTAFTYSSQQTRKITNLFKHKMWEYPSRTQTPYSSSQSQKQTTRY